MPIPGDILILTDDGFRLAVDLVDEYFEFTDDKEFKYKSDGFWYEKNQDIYKLTLDNGASIKSTLDHRLLNSDDEWVSLGDIQVGDTLKLFNNDDGIVKAIENIGHFNVYNCSVLNGIYFITEGGFYVRANSIGKTLFV